LEFNTWGSIKIGGINLIYFKNFIMIQKLPKNIINILAAGEVVERPYSVVKELVENSLDAGADEIIVDVTKWWTKLIKVQDNWQGISKEDLPLTIEEFATSKIKNIEDLYNLHSFWFRGEALSTISEVSKFRIRSKTKDSQIWYELEKIWTDVKITPVNLNFEYGTIIFVEDLFYNLPVRQKFLKSQQTEFKYIQDLMQNYAIKHFDKSFKLIHNQKVIFNYNKTDDFISRLKQIFPSSWAENYLPFEFSDGKVTLWWVLWKSILKFNSNMIKIFVNSRPVKDKIIQKAIMQAYSRWIQPGMYPFVILFMEIDPKLVDVNVHPRKEEVKFIDPWNIYNLVFNVIKENLEKDKWIESKAMKISLQNLKKGSFKKTSELILNQPKKEKTLELWFNQNIFSQTEKREFEDIKVIWQIFSSYILFEKWDELYIMDQHAVAERIIFEKMKKEYNPEKQFLLTVPIILNIKDVDEEKIKQISKLWFDISKFWPDKVIVYSVPEVLNKYDVDIFWLVNSLLFSQKEDISIDKMFENVIATKSCKAAIKANHKLSFVEMEQLIKDWQKYIEGFFVCQHGRPSVVKLSKDDIDKFFDRK